MLQREYVERAISRTRASGNAFWVGHPSDEAKHLYFDRMGIATRTPTEEEACNAKASQLLTKATGQDEIDFNLQLGSDMTWISPELDMRCWQHPEGRPMWDTSAGNRDTLGAEGVFAHCEDVREIDNFDWPDPKYINLDTVLRETQYAHEKGLAVFGGMWCPFFHVLADFFGMENYFCKMYTDPEIVHAATERIVDFYERANHRVFQAVGSQLSAGFFGNDLGTQLDLMISPDCFDEFILPYAKRIIATIKDAHLPVAMHSCGAIDRIIGRLIDAGVDILHPLQARASGMDARSLAANYKHDLVFMGGVDTQDLLPFGSAKQVYDEVLRLRDLFGDGFIVSPSHEALLPNVPFENVVAMSEAAKA